MRFRIGSIPVVIRPAFLVMGLLIGYGRAATPISLATWIAVVFVSVLFHELGHAFAFIRFGHRPSIELHQMGGFTRGTPGVSTTPGRDALISLAGPCAGFLLGGLVFAISSALGILPKFGQTIISDLLWVNFGWGIYNLMPIWPLDGGQALVGILRVFSPRYGEKIGLIASCLATIGVVALALSVGWNYGAFIAGWFGINGFIRLQAIWPRRGATADDLTIEKIKSGDLDGARMMLEMHGDLSEVTHSTVEAAYFYSGRFEDARSLSENRFRRFHSATAAYNAACSDARLDRPDAAIAWLRRAIDAGYSDRNSMATDDDLALLRGRPDFEALLRG